MNLDHLNYKCIYQIPLWFIKGRYGFYYGCI